MNEHTAETILSDIVEMLDRTDILEDSREVVRLNPIGATCLLTIGGRQYSLTLSDEEG